MRMRTFAVVALGMSLTFTGCGLFGSDDAGSNPGTTLGRDLADAVGADASGCTKQKGRDWWHCNVVEHSYDIDNASGGRYIVDLDELGCWKAWRSGERILQSLGGSPAKRQIEPGDHAHYRAELPVVMLVKRFGKPVAGCSEIDAHTAAGKGGELAPEQLVLPGTYPSRHLCRKALPPSPQTTVPVKVWRNPHLRSLLCQPS
jgi:hypothetical protein